MLSINIDSRKLIHLKNEKDLQLQVVKYLRSTDLLFTTSHTDKMLGSDSDRIEAVALGYTKGLTDLYVYTPHSGYHGLAIELKSPTGFGRLSKDQNNVLNKLCNECNVLCLVSNDYTEILEVIIKYIHNLL